MKKTLFVCTLSAALSMGACTNPDSNADGQDTTTTTTTTTTGGEANNDRDNDTIVVRQRQERERYATRINVSLDSMQKQVSTLDERIEKAGGKAKQELMEARDALVRRIDRTRTEASRVDDKADASTDDFRSRVDRSMDSVRSDWNKLMERMKVDGKAKRQ